MTLAEEKEIKAEEGLKVGFCLKIKPGFKNSKMCLRQTSVLGRRVGHGVSTQQDSLSSSQEDGTK